jgi:hypothetical protein
MEQNHESSFWKSNMRVVPGRPSPKKDPKKYTASTSSSFENYQKSVSDAWNLSEDELTKEYCILTTEEQKLSLTSRRPPQCAPKVHLKIQLPVVHKASSSTSSNSPINYTTANSELPPQQSSSNRSQSVDTAQKQVLPTSIDHQVHTSNASNEKTGNVEYGYVCHKLKVL